ncbi:MAG: C-GCAxxG-C-C family protein [Desulfurivibrionaceae bacterium]
MLNGKVGGEDVAEISRLAAERAGNLFENHGLCCSEAVMVTLNQGFQGDLPTNKALQMGAGFCHGMGGAGCTCGALAASVNVLGLFLSPHNENGFTKEEYKKIVQEMHDRFRQEFNSTCCRVLSKNVKHDPKAQKANCLKLTRGAVATATDLIGKARRDLADRVDHDFLRSTDKI